MSEGTEKRGRGRPRTITDMKAYKAEWARRDRAKKKAAKTTGGILDGNPMQNALNAALHSNQESGE